jgi:hypothetical protein
MPRGRPKPKTPKQEIIGVVKWAEQQGFLNVAAVATKPER